MKILFVLHLPPPIHGSSMIGKYIKDSKIINTSFETNFINLSTSKTVDEIGKKPFVKVRRYFKILLQVIISLIKHNPKIVYLGINAKGIGFYKDFPIAILTKLFNKKLVLHYHNKGVQFKQHKLLDNILYRILFKNTKVILLSKRLYKDVSKYVKKEDVFICPNGIPTSDDLKDSSLKVNDIPQLLFLSNLIESKGVFILLGALKILNDNNVKFHCNFVGGAGDISSEQLNQKINDLKLQNCVLYLGKKYDNDKHEIFKASNIFLLPTHYHNECFPLVLLETMMFSLPIISTSEGGIPDIVKDGETGFIVNKQNSNQLAEKIKWLIEHPEEASIMGKKGSTRFMKYFTLNIFEKKLVNILSQI
ncbi:glycosyltransferase family 4 protein [Flavobacteriaceae bacterium]|nr:glycosyltransferase family 4 protein [Flavobacteriaceae bacterium]